MPSVSHRPVPRPVHPRSLQEGSCMDVVYSLAEEVIEQVLCDFK